MKQTANKDSSVLPRLDVESVRHYLTTEPDVVYQDNTTRAYEEAIVRLIDRNPWSYDTVRVVLQTLIDDRSDPNVAYAAFYALCTYYRRNRLKSDYNELLHNARPAFRERKSFAFLLLMCRKQLDPNDYSLLEDADRLCAPDQMGHNYGVEHCFAEYVALACEKDPSRAPFYVTEYLEIALTRVNDAIKRSNGYAKFHVTRARLQTLKAMYADVADREAYFKQALADIELAISREIDKNKQIDYQLTGIQLQSKFYENLLEDAIRTQETTLMETVHESNVKNLEFIGFFSGVIGLLIAGTQLMLGMSFAEGATLIVVLTGCLITAFGALGFMVHDRKQRIIGNCVMIAIGLILTIVAMLYGAHYAM